MFLGTYISLYFTWINLNGVTTSSLLESLGNVEPCKVESEAKVYADTDSGIMFSIIFIASIVLGSSNSRMENDTTSLRPPGMYWNIPPIYSIVKYFKYIRKEKYIHKNFFS